MLILAPRKQSLETKIAQETRLLAVTFLNTSIYKVMFEASAKFSDAITETTLTSFVLAQKKIIKKISNTHKR